MITSTPTLVTSSLDPKEVERFCSAFGFTRVQGKPASWSKQYRLGDSHDHFWLQLDNTEKGLFGTWGFSQSGSKAMLVEESGRPTFALKNLTEYADRGRKSFDLLSENLKDLQTWAKNHKG